MTYFFLNILSRIFFKLLDVLLRNNRQSFYLVLILWLFGVSLWIASQRQDFSNSKTITGNSKIKSQKYTTSKQQNKKKQPIKLEEPQITESKPNICDHKVENELVNMDQNEHYRLSHKNVHSVNECALIKFNLQPE